MDTSLLFKKHGNMMSDGLPWVVAGERVPHTAACNPNEYSTVSAILVRALLNTLKGSVGKIVVSDGVQTEIIVRSSSDPSKYAPCWLNWNTNLASIPFGAPTRITYYFGILGICEALGQPKASQDFLRAYLAALKEYDKHGLSEEIYAPLLVASDELYYWMNYKGNLANPVRLEALEVWGLTSDGMSMEHPMRLSTQPLTDAELLQHVISSGVPLKYADAASEPELVVPSVISKPYDFVGTQAPLLEASLRYGDTVLMAGPTGTGKTFALHQVASRDGWFLITVEGKEGLTDLDFIGAILPHEDGSRRWVDGPVFRAVRKAQNERVLLFLDEVNRVPRVYLNMLLGLMNQKPAQLLRKMGIAVEGDGMFYMLEAPMTSEIVICPVANLSIVAAGNFGRAYQVYDLDPAVRRRFDTVIEFSYLDYMSELSLVKRQVKVSENVADVIVKVAQETRRLMANGELPGCIDTASLLNWARKCERMRAVNISTIMSAASITWADTVCGRDHVGHVNQANLKAISDYIGSLGLLR